MIYYSPDDFKIDCESLAHKIKAARLACKIIYGIPQGGTALALELGRLLGKRVIDTKELAGWDKEYVLVVDDVVDSGATLARFAGYQTAAIHVKKTTPLDLYPCFTCQVVDDWITYWWESTEEKSIQDNIVRILQFIGEDPSRKGLIETPDRVVRSWTELYAGYKQDPKDIFKVFDDEEEQFGGLVYLKNIEFHSHCEHHLLPFSGNAFIAYIPNGPVIGTSKMARLLDVFACRLQMQERIGEQITNALMQYLKPIGAACLTEAKHLCIACRGVKKQHSVMGYSSMKGVFLEKSDQGVAARAELMSLWSKP
jgi:GTP cyclohydrolase IA